jgi:hypothetical protein
MKTIKKVTVKLYKTNESEHSFDNLFVLTEEKYLKLKKLAEELREETTDIINEELKARYG